MKNIPAMQETWETQVLSLGQEDPRERGKWPPTPVFLPEKSHGQKNLARYSPSPKYCKELGMTERLSTRAHMVSMRPRDSGWGGSHTGVQLSISAPLQEKPEKKR